jgi:hypothetical protein
MDKKIPIESLNALIEFIRVFYEDTGELPNNSMYANMCLAALNRR